MKVIPTTYTISDVRDLLKSKKMRVDQTYQRNPGIWPDTVKSYFIDTILEGYPFPKIYIHENYNKELKQSVKEIVDGQQRITTINSFINDDFSITGESDFKGKKFSTLTEDEQEKFLMYSIDCALITSSERGELLEMFRRINSYTVPLNPSEKRHASYQGEFKWFINELSEDYSALLEEYKILTPKQILRMADTELYTELALALQFGVINKQKSSLDGVYKNNDSVFINKETYQEKFKEFFDLLSNSFYELKDTYMMKSYAIHSLFCALMQRKYGLPSSDEKFPEPKGSFFDNQERVVEKLRSMALAHETQDKEGEFKEYVEACITTTHGLKHRNIRTKCILKALDA